MRNRRYHGIGQTSCHSCGPPSALHATRSRRMLSRVIRTWSDHFKLNPSQVRQARNKNHEPSRFPNMKQSVIACFTDLSSPSLSQANLKTHCPSGRRNLKKKPCWHCGLVPLTPHLIGCFYDDHYDLLPLLKPSQDPRGHWSKTTSSLNRAVVKEWFQCYGQEVGPRYEDVAKHCQAQHGRIIKRHIKQFIAPTADFASRRLRLFRQLRPMKLAYQEKTTPRFKSTPFVMCHSENQTRYPVWHRSVGKLLAASPN